MSKPVVAHAIRGYLARTETFVGNQVTMLQDHRSIVIAHHRSPNREFDIDDLYIINERSKGLRRKVEKLAYSTLKRMMRNDVEAAASWVKNHSPALWHFHYAVDAAFFLPLYRRLKLPAVVSLYGYDISSFPNKLGGFGRRYIKRIFNVMDCFLAMTEDMKRDAITFGIPEEKIIVHYHGINAQRFRFDERTYKRKKPFNILCVGTLEPKKGQHHLLRSLAELWKARPDIDAKVMLVGKGPLQKELERIIQQHKLHDRVELTGYIPHLDPKFLQCYRDADVFVHFSTTQPDYDKEGIPGTIVEAMASGLPVISTHHAGIPEAITNGVHGILLEEKDVAGITTSLIQLNENEEMRKRLGQAAAQRALNDLDVRTRTRNLERIYNSTTEKVHSETNNGNRMRKSYSTVRGGTA